MYDEDDHFSRWVQFLCAIPLLFIGGGLLYWSSIDLFDFRQNYDIYSMDGVGIALFVVGGRMPLVCHNRQRQRQQR